jgi:hypothetical protein
MKNVLFHVSGGFWRLDFIHLGGWKNLMYQSNMNTTKKAIMNTYYLVHYFFTNLLSLQNLISFKHPVKNL